jgi:Lar family restriction alleviation protein
MSEPTAKKMTERKGCPFCGEIKDLVVAELIVGPIGGGEGDYGERTAVECQKCGALGPWGDTFKKAAESWNKRQEEKE